MRGFSLTADHKALPDPSAMPRTSTVQVRLAGERADRGAADDQQQYHDDDDGQATLTSGARREGKIAVRAEVEIEIHSRSGYRRRLWQGGR